MATKMGETYDELVDVTGVKERVSPEEWETRVNLAACYRMVWEYGWHHLNLNHISARVPGDEEHVLLNPYGPMYNEVTASNLVKVDLDGNVIIREQVTGSIDDSTLLAEKLGNNLLARGALALTAGH